MFEELMRTTGNDEKATRMALSIIENYVEEGIRYANAKRYNENTKDFIKEVEAFIEGVTFAIPSIVIIDDTQVRNQIIHRIIDDLTKVELD
jgi:Cu/Ag efflux pump CusA